jgi:hypothetical protein
MASPACRVSKVSAFHSHPVFTRVAGWEQDSELSSLTLERVSEISRVHGADFAAALLYDRAVSAGKNASAIEQIDRIHEPANHGSRRVHVGIVPGAFHVEKMDTGADGRRLRAIASGLGYQVSIVPTESFGSIRQNAQIICDWLRRQPTQTILVCLSKGSAEVKYALASDDLWCAFQQVRAWINVSGMLNGTPLVQWLSTQRLRTLGVRLFFGWRGYQYGVLDELRIGKGTLLDFDPPLPPGMRIINVVGFPVRSHLTSPMARRQYKRILACGPSDGGGILLADACRFPGVLYPVWGADHYLRPEWDISPLIGKILKYAVS